MRPYAPCLFVIETPEYRAVVAGETFMMSPAKATRLDGSSWTKPVSSCSLIILRNLPCLRVVSSRGTSVRAQPGAINMSLARNELRNELEMRGVNEAGQTTTCNHNLQSSRNFTDPNVVLRRPKLLAAIAHSKYTCRALCLRSSAGSTPPKGQTSVGVRGGEGLPQHVAGTE